MKKKMSDIEKQLNGQKLLAQEKREEASKQKALNDQLAGQLARAEREV